MASPGASRGGGRHGPRPRRHCRRSCASAGASEPSSCGRTPGSVMLPTCGGPRLSRGAKTRPPPPTQHWLDNLVLPQLGELQLHECDIAYLDAFFTLLEQARGTVEHEDGSPTEKVRYAANTRRNIRAIVTRISSRPYSTRPSPPTRSADWNASSPPRATARPAARPHSRRAAQAARLRRHRQGRYRCGPARPDPLRDRLGPAHRGALRGPLA